MSLGPFLRGLWHLKELMLWCHLFLRMSSWSFCVGIDLNPRLSHVDVNHLAKEQTELANYLAYACSLRVLAVEDAFYGENFVSMIFSNWRAQRF